MEYEVMHRNDETRYVGNNISVKLVFGWHPQSETFSVVYLVKLSMAHAARYEKS